MDKLLTTTVAATLAGVLALPLALAATMTTTANGSTGLCPTTTTIAAVASSSSARWDVEQRGNAATIVAVGARLAVPARGLVIALATAMQESSLRNLAGGDRDSVGLFQQRPSAGWGTPTQLHDPAYAAERFYRALLTVPGWQSIPLTEAAQAVQRSAYPRAYADDEPAASTLLAELTGSAAGSSICGAFTADGALPTAFTPPSVADPRVARAVGWALLQVGTPYSYGGDCTDAHSGNPQHQCDCSSLVQMAYRNAGIALPRTADAQAGAGVPVPIAQVQPGDLLFSTGADGTPTRPGHVVMALGNGWIIEAPRTGLPVRVTELTAARAADIVAVRRIITS